MQYSTLNGAKEGETYEVHQEFDCWEAIPGGEFRPCHVSEGTLMICEGLLFRDWPPNDPWPVVEERQHRNLNIMLTFGYPRMLYMTPTELQNTSHVHGSQNIQPVDDKI